MPREEGRADDHEFVVTWRTDGWDDDLDPGARVTVRQMHHLEEFTWDHRNRLISVTDYTIDGFSETEGKDLPGPIGQKALVTQGDCIEYQYDVLDNLVSKEVIPAATAEFPTIEAYVVSLGHRVIEIRDAPGENCEIIRRLISGDTNRLWKNRQWCMLPTHGQTVAVPGIPVRGRDRSPGLVLSHLAEIGSCPRMHTNF